MYNEALEMEQLGLQKPDILLCALATEISE